MNHPRKLAAILAADVVGFSRQTAVDEEGTLQRLRAFRTELIDPATTRHRGRLVKTMGDGFLIEFASVVDAVRCAIEIQRGADTRNVDVPSDHRIEVRIGVNVGDVVIEGDDLLGDGVNVAARLESIADPGGISISDSAYQQVRDKLDATFADAGLHTLKNIPRPVVSAGMRGKRSLGWPTQGSAGDDDPIVPTGTFAESSNLQDVIPNFRRPEDRDKFVGALRQAGLPE